MPLEPWQSMWWGPAGLPGTSQNLPGVTFQLFLSWKKVVFFSWKFLELREIYNSGFQECPTYKNCKVRTLDGSHWLNVSLKFVNDYIQNLANCNIWIEEKCTSNCISFWCRARMVCLKQMGLLLQTCHLEQSSRKINIRNLPVRLELSFRTSNCPPHHKYRRLSNQGGRNTIIYFNLENPFYHPLPLSIWHFDHFRVNLTMTYKVCKA